MKYSPTLKKAMAEIQQIIKNYDLAAFVCLSEPGFSEYLHVINPSFSAAQIKDNEIRINTKSLTLTPSEKSEMIATTANMLALLSKTTMEQGYNLGMVSKQFDAIVGADHTDDGHISQTEIDN